MRIKIESDKSCIGITILYLFDMLGVKLEPLKIFEKWKTEYSLSSYRHIMKKSISPDAWIPYVTWITQKIALK